METKSLPQKQSAEAARDKFIRALREAKRHGVDVDEIFSGEKERIVMAQVKAFGVAFFIFWGALAPLVVMWFKVELIKQHLEHSWIPIDLTYWMAAICCLSVIAFAFNLVDINDYLPRLPSRKDHDHEVLFTPDDFSAEGDV